MRFAQLPSSFMLISIIGFFISVFVVYPASMSYGFAFALVFVIMFISAIISMTKAELDLKEHLYLHNMPKHVETHRKRVKEHVRSLHSKKA